jgi:hypothetical protein
MHEVGARSGHRRPTDSTVCWRLSGSRRRTNRIGIGTESSEKVRSLISAKR